MSNGVFIEGITKEELFTFIEGAIGRLKGEKQLEDRLYTAEETARFLGIHKNTLHLWKREGRIKAEKIGNRTIRYTRQEIEKHQRTHI